jgi:hypothetical protein
MNEDFWNVKDVMDYFGEELKSEEKAKKIMEMVEIRVKSGTYFQCMNEVREILKEVGINTPFRAIYRRTKR